MKIYYSKPANKFLKKQDAVTENRIKKAINNLPFGDVKRMQGKDFILYRLRIGDFRVTFTKGTESDENGTLIEVIYVEDIDSRGGIYK